jgi:predicted transposase YdaD
VSKPFDATSKALIEFRPADWPAFLGVAARSVEVLDADVSTVTAATDKVLLVETAAGDCIQHFDFQSSPDASVPRRTHGYSALLEERHLLPVDSVVVLLRPAANLTAINGRYEKRLPGVRKPYLRFRYRVIRVWELPVEDVLRAGISVLPLAPISAVSEDELPAVIARMKQRLDAESEQGKVSELWTATKLFLGMRYLAPFVDQLLQGVHNMKESTTYQAILEEGRKEGQRKGRLEGRRKGRLEGQMEGRQEGRLEGGLEEARKILVRVGTRRFTVEPSAEQRTLLEAIKDMTRLEDLIVRVGEVATWAELLAAPAAPSPTAETGPEKRPTARRRKKT